MLWQVLVAGVAQRGLLVGIQLGLHLGEGLLADDSAPTPGNPKKQQRHGNNGQRARQALCPAPPEGWGTSELMSITGWKRTKLYRHLREYAEADAQFGSAGATGALAPPTSRHRE
jgi:hypothetical protein